MRHGVALERQDPATSDDAERPLTAEGLERTRLAAHGLVTLGAYIDAVVTSPLKRAVQTAAIAAEALGVPPLVIERSDLLVPEASPDDLLPVLRAMQVESVLLVGHAPHLDLLVARLLGVTRSVTSLKKAGVAVLEAKLHSDTARLVALYEPKTLRQLGRVR
jgi:phosphohistidine phosphatase